MLDECRYLSNRHLPDEHLRPVTPMEHARSRVGRSMQITVSVHDEHLYPKLFEAMRTMKPIPVTLFDRTWLVRTAVCERGEVTFTLLDMGLAPPAPAPFLPAPPPRPEPPPPLTPVQRALRAPQRQSAGLLTIQDR